MAVVAVLSQNVIQDLTLKDIQNVTRLTKTNIHAEISQEFIEPVNTSVIMAQNTLALNFMNKDVLETEESMAEYLTAIQNVTGYESVFWVPHSTLSYYHPGGTDEKVNLESDDSYWYKKRMDAEDDYSIVVNSEQLDDWALTAYVNVNIKDDGGSFAGVTGVGKRIVHLQDILMSYINNQSVEAYLINNEGNIQVHHDVSLIQHTSFYDLESISSIDFTLKKNEGVAIEKQIGDKYVIIQYMPMLDWYLVVSKSTSELTPALNQYSLKIYTALAIAVLMMMLATSVTIGRYKKQIITLSNIDQLTCIPNRTIFDKVLTEAVKTMSKRRFCLALFDLDNLKLINDQQGHDKGDYALRAVAAKASKFIKEPNLVSRVGGDEFGIVIFKPLNKAKKILEDFFEDIQNDPDLKAVEVTVSIGITESRLTDSKGTIYKRTDKALYQSKNSGKNNIQISD